MKPSWKSVALASRLPAATLSEKMPEASAFTRAARTSTSRICIKEKPAGVSLWDPMADGVYLRQEPTRLARQDRAAMVGALHRIFADLELINGYRQRAPCPRRACRRGFKHSTADDHNIKCW